MSAGSSLKLAAPESQRRLPFRARRVNVEATANIVQACKEHSALCIYISTDYVFPGKPGEAPYEAEDPPQPTNLYGQTKLDGEKVLLKMTGDDQLGVVLRVRSSQHGSKNHVRIAASMLTECLERYLCCMVVQMKRRKVLSMYCLT